VCGVCDVHPAGGRYLKDLWLYDLNTLQWSAANATSAAAQVQDSEEAAAAEAAGPLDGLLPASAGHSVTPWNDGLLVLGGHVKVSSGAGMVQRLRLRHRNSGPFVHTLLHGNASKPEPTRIVQPEMELHTQLCMFVYAHATRYACCRACRASRGPASCLCGCWTLSTSPGACCPRMARRLPTAAAIQ
jgi:hypothetical protein